MKSGTEKASKMENMVVGARSVPDTGLHPRYEFFRETCLSEIPEFLDEMYVGIFLSEVISLAREGLVGGEEGLETVVAAMKVFGEEAALLVRVEDGELEEIEKIAKAGHVAIILQWAREEGGMVSQKSQNTQSGRVTEHNL